MSWLQDIPLPLGIALFFWAVLSVSMFLERRRFHNCFLLLVALAATVPFLCSLTGERAEQTFVFFLLAGTAVLLIVPFFLMGNGIVLLRREGFRAAHLLSLGFGLLILLGEGACFGAVYSFGGEFMPTRTQQLLVTLLLAVFGVSVIYVCLVFLSFLLYNLFIQVIPRTRDFDYVIIHGAGLLEGERISPLLAGRIDKAIEVYRKDPTPPMLVPSGGRGEDETVSEAQAMADYLLAHGIPREKLLLEDSSLTTMENLANSARLIQERPGRHFTALVTSNYHVYRALSYTAKLGFPCIGIGSHTAFYYWPSAMLREFAAIVLEKKNLRRFLLGWALFLIPVWLGFLFLFILS